MPFTLAHPAAIIPLHKIMGRRVSISALVIGSMTPDFAFFLPIFSGEWIHSLWGIFAFCLPAGLIAYVIFHLLLKRPTTTLLPRRMSYRLSPVVFDGPLLSRVSLWAVVMSIILGACTHIAWDEFTHGDTVIVQRFEILRTVVGTVGGYKFYLFKILQHLSTLMGLLALGLWIFGWAKTPPFTSENFETRSLSVSVRGLVIGCMLAIGFIGGVLAGASARNASFDRYLFHVVVGGIIAAALSLVVFSLGWHAYLSYRNRTSITAVNRTMRNEPMQRP